jgi:hypothetical protein
MEGAEDMEAHREVEAECLVRMIAISVRGRGMDLEHSHENRTGTGTGSIFHDESRIAECWELMLQQLGGRKKA